MKIKKIIKIISIVILYINFLKDTALFFNIVIVIYITIHISLIYQWTDWKKSSPKIVKSKMDITIDDTAADDRIKR